ADHRIDRDDVEARRRYDGVTDTRCARLPPRQSAGHRHIGHGSTAGRGHCRDLYEAIGVNRPWPIVAVDSAAKRAIRDRGPMRLATEVGRCLPRVAACATVGALLACLAGGRPPRLVGLVLAAPALVLALSANLIAQHAFAGAAFWVRDARSTWFLYQKLVFILG